MKATFLLVSLTSSLLLLEASASLYVYDPVNVDGPGGYIPGQSLSHPNNNAKPAAEGAWTGPVSGATSYSVTEIGLTFAGLETSGGGLQTVPWGTNRRPFSTADIQTPVYYSFLIQFTEFNNSMIVGVSDSAGNVVSGIRVYDDGTLCTRSAGGVESSGGYQLSLNATYLIVGRATFSDELTFTDLWINPLAGEDEPAVPSLSGVGIPAGGASQWYSFLADAGVGAPAYYLDEFRAGSTWESVTPAAIPEPGSVVSLLMGIAAAGIVCGHFCRPTTAKNLTIQ